MASDLLSPEFIPLPTSPALTPVVQDEVIVPVEDSTARTAGADPQTELAPEHTLVAESTPVTVATQEPSFLVLTPTVEPAVVPTAAEPVAAEPVVESKAEDSASSDSDSSLSNNTTSNEQTEASSQATSPGLRPVSDGIDTKIDDTASVDSGFGSSTSSPSNSTSSLPLINLTPTHLSFLNSQLEHMHPMDILRFAKVLFPNLYQTTAFGLSGLATIDMLAKLERDDKSKPAARPVDLIFLDTLYHFPETYDLVKRIQARYPQLKIHTFKPDGVETAQEFEDTYGEKLYEMSAELYDWIAKVEPQQRAFDTLRVAAVLTGRRRSQGGARGRIPVIEVDDERGIVKINPLVTWTFPQVREYIRENDVPYNVLLDRGYKSIGDWHSTSPVGEGEDERAGRWKGQDKTECGIHNKKSKYAKFLQGGAAASEGQGQQITAA